jgi:hypothetical protein
MNPLLISIVCNLIFNFDNSNFNRELILALPYRRLAKKYFETMSSHNFQSELVLFQKQ